MYAFFHIVFNLILLFGIILLTIYITKASNNNFNKHCQSGLRRKIKNNDIYDEKVNDVFKKMFTESSILKDYQKYDETNKNIKLYGI
jgi:translation initiation factor 2 beta subunit (eIF-2beta)/eIF-5